MKKVLISNEIDQVMRKAVAYTNKPIDQRLPAMRYRSYVDCPESISPDEWSIHDYYNGYHDCLKEKDAEMLALRQQTERLKGVVEFYADINNWSLSVVTESNGKTNNVKCLTQFITLDGGNKAREILETLEKKDE